jgi:tRNA U34 2-thiouridine synthase MnmA/TrmU
MKRFLSLVTNNKTWLACTSRTIRHSSASTIECYSKRKIGVALSGGVDSSVVAYLLSHNQPNDEVTGIHMSNWDYADEAETTVTTPKKKKYESYCWEQDWKDARAVASQLNIPIHHVSFQAEYWNDVFQPYCQHISQSITPNPDVDCNKYIKFGALKDYLKKTFRDIDYLATGHYARLWDRSISNSHMPEYLQRALEEEDSTILADYILHKSNADKPVLLSARDRSKDQSYFLSSVPAEAFSRVLFPLGDLYKNVPSNNSQDDSSFSVREVAKHAKLPNASKRDSVGICFIGKRKHGDFINEYIDLPSECDDNNSSSLVQCINVENNDVISTFDPVVSPSLIYSTIGQGAKISGVAQKWFVVDKYDKWKSPCLLVCPGTHHPSLYADRLYIRCKDLNWMAGGGDTNRPPPLPFFAKCRIRHLQPLVDCEIVVDSNCMSRGGDGFDSYEIRLKLPLRGIAQGQVCVFYSGGKEGDLICLGGGLIDRRGPNYWEMQKDLPKILHPSGHNDNSSIEKKWTEKVCLMKPPQ